MALLPDPTTAASERSSVKNRLTGSRRRGSGINGHRSRTVSKTSLRGSQKTRKKLEKARMRGGCRGGPGGPGVLGGSRGVQGGPQKKPEMAHPPPQYQGVGGEKRGG